MQNALLKRFRLETRCSWSTVKCPSAWMVAFDKNTGQYVLEPGRKAYKKFANSDAAFEYLETLLDS